jgi:hypothetical protein
LSTFIKTINDKYIIYKRHFMTLVINIIIIRLIIGKGEVQRQARTRKTPSCTDFDNFA